jgi:hypothetical protein
MVDGKLIPKPLAWSQVRDAFALSAPLLRTAYDKSGRKPDTPAFSAPEAKDMRGAPVWDLQNWRERT